ncbi:MAG TPA: hypothetical protein PLT60_01655 [Candidatus Pacearchaeota archaeon]|jgi:hypothetical protein|nr:hypothetical protein [Candidatus Pacearchaeota archaeon]HNZ51885.1 hypothetical protein [Candidatus Pacearchaeota archaeon]HOF44021.1 hypothetical protein [Candidatus Pacearchaeota archaeon]HOR52071.1 hypothetical protein [Candidatus Pacearchaeota archaeon]HOU79003.1 hypothetical protein [Candidatus Pacearchaeota archaeon]
MKRKKRLKKGIDSLKEQIEIHEKKKKKAEEADMKELVGYYEKEILSKEKALKEKKALLDKQ